ncbi:patatin-like phospholipase family protein [Marisediminicola sp. LYQ85]|uniref:patatin-like phospholipase family protein n=1 Tax=Marisediminicola sp. LYQ85 TaxID=3391062 RepID=UPI00398396E7
MTTNDSDLAATLLRADPTAGRRGIVLGGGGVAGIAWEASLLTTMMGSGVDLSSADVVVGTSAGSVVGAALRSGDLEGWLRSRLTPARAGSPAAAAAPAPSAAPFAAPAPAASDSPESSAPRAAATEPTVPDIAPFVEAMAAASANRVGEQESRARLGELARTVPSRTGDGAKDAALERFAALLSSPDWPATELRITAVDALDGAFRVFNRSSHAELVRAVAASCAVPGVFPTVDVHGRPHMDGGVRSSTNADVASDCERILVISCGPEWADSPLGPSLPVVAEALGASRNVLVIEADADSLRAFGPNSLLASSTAPSVEAGMRQGATVARRVRDFWG